MVRCVCVGEYVLRCSVARTDTVSSILGSYGPRAKTNFTSQSSPCWVRWRHEIGGSKRYMARWRDVEFGFSVVQDRRGLWSKRDQGGTQTKLPPSGFILRPRAKVCKVPQSASISHGSALYLSLHAFSHTISLGYTTMSICRLGKVACRRVGQLQICRHWGMYDGVQSTQMFPAS